ncbi:hypothetical protein LTR84_011603 [Exophiala bonariae]|uniref:Uncharacterized protein n=1 Tax=Exophiala bonariae TaxID=1690606 RepID=A0AAV9NIZ0_9EURO|nr:hypothetical protein LTR84_011603 [Exophiala bonariae]
MAPIDNLKAKGSEVSIHARAALNFIDAVNEAITFPSGNQYTRLHDIMVSDAKIESAPSSLKAAPEQSLINTLGEQLNTLEGMKGLFKDLGVMVEKVVDGGKETVMFGHAIGQAHSGLEFKDDRVILVQTTDSENDVTTSDAQGSDETRAGLPRIVYVKEFVDSAYLKSFLGTVMGGPN